MHAPSSSTYVILKVASIVHQFLKHCSKSIKVIVLTLCIGVDYSHFNHSVFKYFFHEIRDCVLRFYKFIDSHFCSDCVIHHVKVNQHLRGT